MYKIKELTKEVISNWDTSELAKNFNMTMKKHNKMSEYLASDEVHYCDAINTWEKIREIEEQYKWNNYNLSDIHNEVISRINNIGKRVYLFGDDRVFTSYVLPKCNEDDSMAFIICKDDDFGSLHNKNYIMYLTEDIIRLNYRIDRKTDNSIKWHDYFPKYDTLTPYFNESFESYYISKFNNKYGFVDANGFDITPMKYDYVRKFNCNLAKVQIDNKWGVIDYDGTELIECKYDDVTLLEKSIPSENIPIIVQVGLKFGVINTKGQTIIPIEYDFIEFFRDDMLKVNKDHKYILFDFNGNTITKSEYDRISYFNENLIQIKVNGYNGLINKLGEEVTPPNYYWIDEIKHGLAMVRNENGHGFLDETGKVVVPSIYPRVRVFDKDLIIVSLNNKYGLFDKKGKEITSIQYDKITYFNNEIIKVKIDDKESFINKKGIEVIEPKDNPFTKDFLNEEFEFWEYTGL